MAPYWSPSATAPGVAGRARRASSAGSSSASATVMGPPPLGRKMSSVGPGEAYHRVVAVSSTRNPLYGMHGVGLGLADSVAGSASDDTSASSASASASRHYVDPWDLENFMYLKRHWAAEDAEGEGEASSTPALESTAQSDFYYVGPERMVRSPTRDVDVDVDEYPSVLYRPDSVLMTDEPLSLSTPMGGMGGMGPMSLGVGPTSLGLFNAVEEESFFNERFDPARHHRLVRRSHSAAATYLHGHLDAPRAASVAASAARHAHANAARRRSVACAPRYYRTPITGGDSSGEYEAFEDYADELSAAPGAPAHPHPRTKRHSVAGKPPAPHQIQMQVQMHQVQTPRSRASIAGPAPSMSSRLAVPQPARRRHSHCVAWSAPSPAPGPAPTPAPAHIYSTRRASFSRGQLLAGLHAVHSGRYAGDLTYRAAYGTPYGTVGAGTGTGTGTGAGSSDDCYVSDASEDLAYGDGAGDGDVAAAGAVVAEQQGTRRDAVVDGFTDADLMYVQLASSLYGGGGSGGESLGFGYCGYGQGYGQGYGDCSRFQLTNYGHLKIDYSCSWRSLDHYIAHS